MGSVSYFFFFSSSSSSSCFSFLFIIFNDPTAAPPNGSSAAVTEFQKDECALHRSCFPRVRQDSMLRMKEKA